MAPKQLGSRTAHCAEVWTEGKTDWQILRKALEALELNLEIGFHESEVDMGDSQLLRRLQTFAEKQNPSPLIFLFDHDRKDVVDQVSGSTTCYKDWGNNVFSFAIPIPSHRRDYENVCIEMYFTDEEIQRKDAEGRHLFLTSSFHENSGKHKDDQTIHCTRVGYLKGCTKPEKAKIVDAEVYDGRNRNIALSKASFAEYISQEILPFDNLNFAEFRAIFDIIGEIISISQPIQNIYYPALEVLFNKVDTLSPAEQFDCVYRTTHDVLAMALQLFIVATVRVYEDEIINERDRYRKRVTPIKTIITEAFRQPSLSTLTQLAEKCFHLIDASAPEPLKDMKQCLAATIVLEDIGQMWEDLEALFPPSSGKPKLVNKRSIRRTFLDRVVPEIAQYYSKPKDVIVEGLHRIPDHPSIKIETWKEALIEVVDLLQPIFSHPVVFRKVSRRDPVTDEYTIEVRTYQDGACRRSVEVVQLLTDDYERKSSELMLGDNLRIQVYPLLLVRDDALFFYQRTTAPGYEYYSPVLDRIYIENTKRKFSQSLFQVGSRQELFWTDVLPKENPVNQIRANTPDEGPYEFIGRRRLINQIKDEIITIVNENGILYGPGGIGKTALMIQLSKELFEEKNKLNVLYDNIIWVSAKYDFYDYIFDTIEVREPQVKSLDTILFAILRFFEFGTLEEYTFEDRRELVLEQLQDCRVLLIVDNFETISKGEQGKIIEFFGTTVKKALRQKPQNFKIIATSREWIPSGFRPVELTGLDMRDSKRLINSLFKRYKATHSELTNEQKETLHGSTRGMPLLIKHCAAKIWEYNQPFDTVIRGLPQYTAGIVQFSFKEILEQLEKDPDQRALRILMLLEIIDMPLMVRQVADILELQESQVAGKIPLLSNFECIKRINQDNQEKYLLNHDIQLLTKSLVLKHPEIVREIRGKYYRNFTFDKQMDYESEEEDIIGIFEGYLKNRAFTDAEDFINKELKKRPQSILLNYYYARYLKDRRNEIEQAIGILEHLRGLTHNHPSILKLLFVCYASAAIPKFESADNLVNQIQADVGEYLKQELDLQLEIARFYIRWSTTLKMGRGIDPFEENLRVSRYKELARKALDILLPLEEHLNREKRLSAKWNIKLDEVHYTMSQCYYNLWDYDRALELIDRAIALAHQSKKAPAIEMYEKFRSTICDTANFYQRKPWLDQRRLR